MSPLQNWHAIRVLFGTLGETASDRVWLKLLLSDCLENQKWPC